MQRDDKDMARLWDMLDAARAITSFIEGRSFAKFQTNRMYRFPEIVGNAHGTGK